MEMFSDTPFRVSEVRSALALVFTAEEVEAQIQGLRSGSATGVHLPDGTLLLIASLSDALAKRVVAYKPGLESAVANVRADPEGFVRMLKNGKPE